MKRTILQLCIAAAFSAVISFALPPTIGVASAPGTFVVNNAEVQGNANLFDGAQIKTSKVSSQLFLQNGVSLILGTASSGTIYTDRLILEQGATKIDNMRSFSVDAGDYRIASAQAASQAVVRLNGTSVEVAALTGSLNVFDGGVLLARIGAGTAAAFQNGVNGYKNYGTPRKNNNNVVRRDAALFLLLAALAGISLAVASIGGSEPTSR